MAPKEVIFTIIFWLQDSIFTSLDWPHIWEGKKKQVPFVQWNILIAVRLITSSISYYI